MATSEHPGATRTLQRQALTMTLPAALVASALSAALAAAGGASPIAPALSALGLGVIAATLIHRGLASGAHPHSRLGPGTAITLARGVGIAALAGLATTPEALGQGGVLGGWAVAALALTIAALDAFDGWAARRSLTASAFGARLDVEFDVAFAAAAALVAWLGGAVGIWFLALPLLRPVFLIAGLLLPALAAPLPPAARRSRVAGVQYAGQVALLIPLLAPPLSMVLGAAILALVAGSFALDINALLRRTRAA